MTAYPTVRPFSQSREPVGIGSTIFALRLGYSDPGHPLANQQGPFRQWHRWGLPRVFLLARFFFDFDDLTSLC